LRGGRFNGQHEARGGIRTLLFQQVIGFADVFVQELPDLGADRGALLNCANACPLDDFVLYGHGQIRHGRASAFVH
jgi:hypothetical protein